MPFILKFDHNSQAEHTGIFLCSDRNRWLFYFLSGFPFLFLLLYSHLGWSLPQNLDAYRNARFTQINIDNGLSQNFVPAIARDNLGFIWIGTKDGLNMYDGYRFTIYRHNPFDPYSISDNFIKVIYCDRQGRLWMGTLNGGVNVYDRRSGRFYQFMHRQDDAGSISSNNVQAIAEDRDGNIWIGTNQAGLNRLTIRDKSLFPGPDNVTVERIHYGYGDDALEKTAVICLFTDQQERLWVGTEKYILAGRISDSDLHFERIGCKLINQDLQISAYPLESHQAGRSIFSDSDGDIWMMNRHGLFKYHPSKNVFIEFTLKDPEISLTRSLAAASYLHKNQKEIWVCREDRLVIVSTETGEVVELMHDPDYPAGLQKGHFISLFADPGGSMWIGSNGYGITLYDQYSTKFRYPLDISGTHDKDFLSSRELSIRTFFETSWPLGKLWIGSNSGFFVVDRKSSTLLPVRIDSEEEMDEGLIVYSIVQDSDGLLWLGSSWGLIRYDMQTGKSRIYHPMLIDHGGEPDARISKVYIHKGELWILTPNSLALFDKSSGRFEHYRYSQEPVNRFKEMVYPSIWEDEAGNFWMGTPVGLHYFDLDKRAFTRSFVNNPSNFKSLGFNDVRSIVPDPDLPGKYLWLATGGGGLSRFDLDSLEFTSFTETEGLPNNMVYGMLPDETGILWLSTNNGLCSFDPRTHQVVKYSVSDGLQSNEFNSGAFYKSLKGELFFGGIKGYNCFFSSDLLHKPYSPPVVFTGFSLFSENDGSRQEVSIREIQATGKINLPYRQNYFSVEFSALDYSGSSKKRYVYSFSGKEEQWLDLGGNRSVTFTDVKPGKYTLRVRGTNSDGIWSGQEGILSITVGRPWWKTIWAYSAYLLILISLGMAIRKYELSRVYLANRLRIADLENQKQREVNLMKSEFFANISHEFRTPLTLIKGPVEDMLEEARGNRERKILQMIHANSGKLLKLINQLLDLAKLENGEYRICVSPGNIGKFLGGLVMSFLSVANQRKIQLNYIEDPAIHDPLVREQFLYDRDVVQEIIYNLISNAVKFTPDSGEISVRAEIMEYKPGHKAVQITVADTGIGIPADKLPYIYDRFYQVDPSSRRAHEGTGIGLAYARELVEAHKGTISVESEPEKGTTFRVRFPVGWHNYRKDQILINTEHKTDPHQARPVAENSSPETGDSDGRIEKEKNTGILVVEDNKDVRNYILDCLRNDYAVMGLSGAAEGLEQAFSIIPDLIISDIMMPGMDGYEFCERIKTDDRTSHVPVILLTARSSDEDRIMGLETGADDYLTKPFNRKELLTRIKNLINSRKLLREKFSPEVLVVPSAVQVSSRDSQFLEKLLRIVELNMDNETFGVEDLAAETAMSQSQLHRKLKAVVNMPANHFIRSVRMHRARQLLQQKAGNISEVSFMVGYGDPGYFSKSYRAFFGYLPSEEKAMNP